MHDRVEAVMAIVDRRQGAGVCPKSVKSTRVNAARSSVDGDAIQVDDLVVVRQQLIDHRSAELAAAAGHCDPHTPGHHTGANQAPGVTPGRPGAS